MGQFRHVLAFAICGVLGGADPGNAQEATAANMAKPVQVFILLGQSNMVGLGKIAGGEISLEHAVKKNGKYPYLVDASGNWSERKDVRYVRVMDGRNGGTQLLNNEWLTVKSCKTIGPEFGIGHPLGNAIEAPVLLLKSCIGNRSLGWDLLPPGSERYAFATRDKLGNEKKLVYAGYKDRPESWAMDKEKGLATDPPPWVDKAGKPIDWYAGRQYAPISPRRKKCWRNWESTIRGRTDSKWRVSFSGKARRTAEIRVMRRAMS